MVTERDSSYSAMPDHTEMLRVIEFVVSPVLQRYVKGPGLFTCPTVHVYVRVPSVWISDGPFMKAEHKPFTTHSALGTPQPIVGLK